jgi:micrococcal nuclease
MRHGLAFAILLLASRPAAASTHPPLLLDAIVLHVDDGDTIDVRVDGRIERIRYIGIDAPEVAHDGVGAAPGGEAAAQLNRVLVAGRRVKLELDWETRDRYGRLLAYVWINDTMVNLEMVRCGYARTMVIPPNVRYARRFASAEAEARSAQLGLWSEGGLNEPAIAPLRRHRRRPFHPRDRGVHDRTRLNGAATWSRQEP